MSAPLVETITGWPELDLLEGGDLPDIPADTLPPVAARMVKEVAAETETPQALGLVTALGCMSIAVAGKAVVIPRDGWREPVNIYTIALSVPGTTKSPVLRKMSEPLREWESRAREEARPRIIELRADRLTQEQAIAAMRKKAARFRANGEMARYADAREEVIQAEAALPEVPVEPLLFVTDATPEALRAKLVEHEALGVLSDEGGIFDVVGGLYTGGAANIDVLLQGWDRGSMRVARGKEHVILRPWLTMCLLAQPSVLHSALTKKSFVGRGLLERFLIARPPHRLGFRLLDTTPTSSSATADWTRLINSMLDIPREKNESPIQLSIEARAVWMDARRDIEVQQRPDGDLHHCTGWASKAAGGMLRLAGLFHLAENTSGTISDTNMERAVTLMAHFARHAADAFGFVEPSIRDAIYLVDVLRPHAGGQMTRTELRRRIKGREVSTLSRLNPALEELEERGYIREFEEPTGGRPASIIRIRAGI